MNKQAQVGLFTILGLLAVFAVFFVLSDLGTRRGYQIGVTFRGANGLRKGAEVYLSGVPIGAVDNISLLKDYSTEVVITVRDKFDIPQGSRFLIQAPITGEPTVLIEPPRDVSASVATLPHEVLPIDRQPRGINPTTFADLLEQGQGEVRRLDNILAQFEGAEPQLLGQLKSTLGNANALTTNANRSLASVTTQISGLAGSLQKNLTLASNNVLDLTGNLDSVVKRDSGQVDQLLTQLNRTSKSFGETVDSLHEIATNPALKTNLYDTTRDFALTAKTFAELTGDLRKVTSNQQTQAQLRDTVAQLDATSQKVDSLLASIGGTSHVYGVDSGATPPPEATPAPTPPASGAARPSSAITSPKLDNVVANLRQRINSFSKDLVQLQVRASVLTPLRPGSAQRNVSPLLTSDRGPQSDFNLFVLPHAHTGLVAGVNDVGSGTATGNFMLLNRGGALTYGGGIEYSRAGLTASLAGKSLGFETRVYDLRHPTLDTYLNLFALPKLQIFGGERDLIHASRRTVLGVQFEL